MALFKFPTSAMATTNTLKTSDRPSRPLHVSKSFTRAPAPSPGLSTRSHRANTVQGGTIPEISVPDNGEAPVEHRRLRVQSDVFDRSSQQDDDDHQNSPIQAKDGIVKLPADFDELPIELLSLTDRFVRESSSQYMILNNVQLSRLSVCQSTSDASICRASVISFPGLLCSCGQSH